MFAAICALIYTPYSYAGTADDFKSAQAEVSNMKASADSSKAEYLSAIRYKMQLESELDEEKSELSEIDAELDEQNAMLSDIIVSEYKYSSSDAIVNILTESSSLEDFINNIECMHVIMNYRAKMLSDVAALKEQHETKANEIETCKSMSAEIAESADTARSTMEESISAMQPAINTLRAQLESERSAISSYLASESSYNQMQSDLDYLSKIMEVTDEQSAIIQSAYSTPYSGSNMCEAWAESVYRNAGIDVPLVSSAYAAWLEYGISDDKNSIPPGAWVYGSGTDVVNNHVGIYIGGGLIMDNEGSKTKTAVQLDKWLSWQTAVSAGTGKSGWIGWGYPQWIGLLSSEL